MANSLRIKIGPSILNSNLANLTAESKQLMKNGADYLHLDVMDGHFVPNITFGHGVVKCLRKDLGPEPFFDVHMMVANPSQWIDPMADAGCSQYTYHFESVKDQASVIRRVKEAGMRVGLAIKPKTDVDVLYPYIEDIDTVLIMTVEPGFGGQKFLKDMMSKVRALRDKYNELDRYHKFAPDIGVDGGVGPTTVGQCCSAGANMIVSGTAITQAPDSCAAIENMRRVAQQCLANN